MFFAELLLAFALALAFALLIVHAAGRPGPGPAHGVGFFLLFFFLAIWAAGAWITPFGPVAFGVPWLAFLVTGFVVFLLAAALTPPRRPVRTDEAREGAAEAAVAAIGSGLLFWTLLVVLAIAIGAAYTAR